MCADGWLSDVLSVCRRDPCQEVQSFDVIGMGCVVRRRWNGLPLVDDGCLYAVIRAGASALVLCFPMA